MSQHDYALANAAGAAFRTDANNALLAIVSQNSGASEPSTTFAYQWWADTTSGWLKQRNAANSAWIKRQPIGTGARADIASASTLDLDANAASSGYLRITGTTTITAVTLTDGQQRLALAGGAFTVTHGASLVVPGAANYTTTAGDLLLFIGESAGVVRVVVFPGGGVPMFDGASRLMTCWIPAGAMASRTTSGAAAGTAETTTNKVMVKTLDFDASTDEFAQFAIRMPKSWNEGTVTAAFLWSNASGTGNVVWGLQAVAISDDDALDAAFGTAQTVTDSVTAAGDLMQSAATSAITIAGTPAAGDLVVFQAYRDADNGSDTLAGDARLHGVTLFYTIDTMTDA